jgi:hypothetical protein
MRKSKITKLRRIRSINIMGVKHKVRYIKIEGDGNGYYSDGLVEINREITDVGEFLKVLIHEGMHGVFEKTGIHQDISLPQEHAIIDSVSTFLFTNFNISLK